jgi:hypothetical protein
LAGVALLGAVSHRAFKPIAKSALESPGRRWEDNIRINLEKQLSIRGIGLIRLRIGITGELL